MVYMAVGDDGWRGAPGAGRGGSAGGGGRRGSGAGQGGRQRGNMVAPCGGVRGVAAPRAGPLGSTVVGPLRPHAGGCLLVLVLLLVGVLATAEAAATAATAAAAAVAVRYWSI